MPRVSMGMPNIQEILKRTRARRYGYLMPIIFIIYLINYMDRTNIGFAEVGGAFTQLGVPASMVGIAVTLATLFLFIGYSVPEPFTNLLVAKKGLKWVVLGAFLSWGTVTLIQAFVTNITQFYIMRLLVGVAESPWYPGVVFYLTLWFTKEERGLANAFFNMAIPLASVLGGFIAGEVYTMFAHTAQPWRYLFMTEGILSIILAFFALLLPNNPNEARWLREDEKKAITTALEEERRRETVYQVPWKQILLTNRDAVLLALTYMFVTPGAYTLATWMAPILHTMGFTAAMASFVTAILMGIAALIMIFVLFYSDILVRRGTPRARRNTFFTIMGIYAVGLVLSGLSLQLKIPILAFAFFILAAIGIYLSVPAFWNLVQQSFSSEVGAFVIGVANGVGNLVGATMGVFLPGLSLTLYHSYVLGMYLTGILPVIGILLVLATRRAKTL